MPRRLSRSLIALSLLAATCAFAATVKIKGLNLPYFDEAERLIRLFTASDAQSARDLILVENGQVQFFNPGSDTTPIALLDFARARYLRSREQIVGEHPIRFQAREGTASGRDFEYDLRTDVLLLKSDVRAEFRGEHLQATRGEFRLQTGEKAAHEVVMEGLLEGNVVVTGPRLTAEGIERIESPAARYVARVQKIFISRPVTAWKNGRPHDLDLEVFEIDLAKTVEPTPDN